MHSFHGKTCTIHFDSGMNGDVHIVSLSENIEVHVSAEDILDFVANYVRNEKIGRLEQESTRKLLGID